MMLILHIVIALGSMFFAAFTYFYPSTQKLYATYVSVAFTFISGFYLVFTKPAHMLEVCTLGLVYLGVVSFGIVSARAKLAMAEDQLTR